jgi:amino acid adenylation domain-containing protein/thioester reductase-like protein
MEAMTEFLEQAALRVGDTARELTPEERRRVVFDFNDNATSYPKDKCLHQLVAEQAALRPDRAAVVFGSDVLTYRELDARSLDLAMHLQSLGVRPDSVVGICVERSLEMIVGILAILRAGAAYLPLDADYPDERLTYMLHDSNATIVLTQKALEGKVASMLRDGAATLIAIDRQWPEIAQRAADARANGVSLQNEVEPHHLAYVIYTSGSTGKPKGVMVEHRAVNRLVLDTNYIDIRESDTFLQLSSLSFDAATLEIWGPLLNGARLVVAPPGPDAIAGIESLIATHSISVLWLTSGLFQSIVRERAEALAGVRIMLTGGDVVPIDCARRFVEVCRGSVLINGYGPTESTTFAACYVVSDGLDGVTSLPIGRPVANTQIYILDGHDQPQPVGVAGELCIAGDGLARGYRNRPELTQEKFVANPFFPGKRMYRSGDLARWRHDGNIEFLGRRDTQVKIRGYRIEIGEIEAELDRHSAIAESVVVAQGDDGDRRLVAFYRVRTSDSQALGTVPSRDLRAHLRRSLPAYMVPATFVSVAAIPLNPNGKVDRAALARTPVTIESDREYVAPRNPAEHELVQIWAEVLGLTAEKIGVHDDFFELGGQSLLATQVIARVRSRLGIDVPLTALFEHTDVAGLAQRIGNESSSERTPIVPLDRSQWERLPLSFAQERVWFHDQLEPESVAYSVPFAWTFRGELELARLEEAFLRIIARHESLRTVFPSRDGRAEQRIAESVAFRLEHVDLCGHGNREDRHRKARELCQAEVSLPFDLARGPLLRVRVITVAEDEHILLVNLHHIVSDGWSIGILIRELGAILDALRDGREPALSTLPIQYADYSVWQRRWLEENGQLERQLAYWEKKLAGVPERLDLPTDFPRTNVRGGARATHSFTLDAALTATLRDLAQRHGATLFMGLLAAVNVLLHRYSGQGDICVGSAFANRRRRETEGLIGMFVNTLPLRSEVDGEASFSTLLSQVKSTCLEAYEHQDAPFEKIVDRVRPQGSDEISPIVQVMVLLQNADMGARHERFVSHPLDVPISTFDLTAEFTEQAHGLAAVIEYSTDLYKPATIMRMAAHFAALCGAIVDAPGSRIRDLVFLGDAERQLLLAGFNATQADYPRETCIHELFNEQVLRDPGKTAVIDGDRALTYQELYDRSCDLALYLQSIGVEPDGLVGLCLERSLEMMVAIMGSEQAGGAYMPADPSYPDDRLAYMLQDSGATIVLTQERFRARVESLLKQRATVIALDTQWAEIQARAEDLKASGIALRREVTSRNVSYVIYTSGSTGKPKGVQVEHQALVNRIHWMQKRYALTAADVVLQKTPYSFDVSVWEFFWPMMTGASLVFAAPEGHKDPRYLESLIKTAKVTTLHFVPSMLHAFLDLGDGDGDGGCDTVRLLFCSGEALDRKSVDRYKGSFPRAELHNLYGPTEAAIDVTAYDCSELTLPFVPIGAPIDNTQIYILDAHNNPQPVGVPGELHIAGDNLARGYLNRDELTREKFVANPFTPGTRMYKTGDLARWLDDGNIQYLGRIDNQVKIRGLRIELGEIEAALAEHPRVDECAVLAQGEGGNKQLVAFYRAAESTPEQLIHLSNDELRAHLSKTLPEYMVPAAFVSLAAIPINSNGKVDRGALSRIDVTIASAREYVAPCNEIEKRIVAIWGDVLNLAPESIGIHDNFFELGGHSLLATQLISKVRSRMNIDVPLKLLFERPSVAQFAVLLGEAAASSTPSIARIDRTQFERLPLSFAQERLWFINQLEPGRVAYNIPLAVRLTGTLDVSVVESALKQIIERHESLRTVFPNRDGRPEQRIVDHLDWHLESVDLSGHEHQETRDREWREICRAAIALPFDLARGPLIRGKVISLARDAHILLLVMHHIISDGWSLGVLLRELGPTLDACGEGRNPDRAPLPIQYADYAVWQRNWLNENGVLARQLAYWQQKLAGLPESLNLFTDHPRPAVESFAAATHAFTLDAQLIAELRSLAQRNGATLYMVLLAAFNVLLYRYTGQSDLCVGGPIANRRPSETEALIGMFVNTLALRSEVDGDQPFSALLAQVIETCLEAYEHQDAPFESVVDALRPQRNVSRTPLFQTMFALQNADMGALDPRFPRVALENGVGAFDLNVEMTETPDGLSASFEYLTDLFEPRTMARMATHFVALCRAIAATPAMKVDDLDFLGETERQLLLAGFNATQADYPRETCIHELFNEQVLRDPGKTAVIDGDRALTYQELYDRSCDLALYLQSIGVGPDGLVGLCLERSLEMMVAIMGSEQAGGAYMPADPSYPDDRLAYMLQDSGATIVLTQERFRARVESLLKQRATVIALDSEWAEIQAHAEDLKARGIALRREVASRNVSYVIYTSGSTGKPKGVQVEHQALVNRIHWMQKRYALSAADVVLQKTPYSFDVSVWEFFWPMITGASVVFAAPEGHKDPRYLESLIKTAKVTTLHFVPSMLHAFLDLADGGCDTVRLLFCSGEALDRKSVDRYKGSFPRAELHNLYGPTEAAIDVTAYDCSELTFPFVPIGAPIDNTQIYILDAHNHPQPVGVPGELHIAGDNLARGYLNRDELTQEKFVANPFTPGTRMYKTGDLARWLDDGNIQYLGRIDNQVKIRGLRIELGEIEAALAEHEGIDDCAVLAQGEGGNKQLVAFYRAAESTPEQLIHLSNDELRAHLSKTLPEYMVPAAFVSLAAIPINSNGKVDRGALSRIDVTIASLREYVAARNEIEKRIAAIWADVLNLAPESVGIHDNFFELGGHSLLATQLISKVRSRMNIDVPLKQLFERPSVAQFAELLGEAAASSTPSIARIDRTHFEQLPLSFAQERLWFLDQLEPGSANYNVPMAFTVRGELEIGQLEQAFRTIVARHESLRTVFPSGEGQVRQVISDGSDFAIARIDLRRAGGREKARDICEAEAATPFDLARGPLLRVKLLTLADDEHIVMLNMHHIVGDGWSVGVLIKELGAILCALREGREPVLPPLPIQYADYSVWQRRWLDEGGKLERQLAYWQKKLAGVPESLDLPTDYPRPSVQSFAGKTHDFAIDPQLTARLAGLAERHGATLFMSLLATFQLLLRRYSGQSDICVGSAIANRQRVETEGLIGMFVNTLPLRSRVEGDETFSALLVQVKTTCLEAYEHQDAPFEKVVDAVRPQRNLAISPIFQVMMLLQNADIGMSDRQFVPFPLQTGISKFDLTFEFTETPAGLAGVIEYSTALYKPATIARMAQHFVALCRSIVEAPEKRIRDLDYLGEAERRQLLVDFNSTQADYPRDTCIHDLFNAQMRRDPARTAVVFGAQTLSYQELYDRSRTLAAELQAIGVGPDGLVGLCMERSPEMLIGVLGILQAGGAYVPLDPTHPDERLAYMLRDSRVAVVLTQERLRERVTAIGGEAIVLDTQRATAQDVRLDTKVEPHHLAYVIYTSGSTGQPKGVMVEHRSVVNYLTHCLNHYISADTNTSASFAHFPLTFDASVTSLFAPLAAGKAVTIETGDPLELFKTGEFLDRGYDFVKLTPAHLLVLRSNVSKIAAASLRKKNLFVVGGEALTADHIAFLRQAGADVEIVNEYGPTEATVGCTTSRFAVGAEASASINIGTPIANAKVYILDESGNPQPIGIAGELYIAGDGLARGYLNREELTRETFVANPFVPGTRMYKSGDRACWLEDGNLRYLGRLDTQVKIRGFRIELGEIEAQLDQHSQVQDSAVIVRGADANKQLIAFYRAKGSTAGNLVQLPGETLRAHLSKVLPESMLPAAFVSVAAIPLNANGKVDRGALARIDVTIGSGRDYVAPRNEAEKRIVAIWGDVLHVAPELISIHDSFFELGGHSLLATQLISKIRTRLEVDVPLKVLFERTTVAQFAELIGEAAQSGATTITQIAPIDRTRFERLPLSFAQERLWFLDQLEPGSANYNVPMAFTIHGELEIAQLEHAFDRIIARHENLRTLFPSRDGQASQVVAASIGFQVERVDLRHDGSKEERERKATEICEADAALPFDLAGGPLLRGKVITLADDEHILLLNLHHIVGDGWSIGVLIKELGLIMSALRDGREPLLAPLPIQYIDYSVWQRRWLEESGTLEGQLAYWQKKLAGLPESLDLPTDYPRPSVQRFAGGTHDFVIDAQLVARLRSLAERKGGTLFMSLLAAFQVLLHRYSSQSDICVGSAIANRQQSETEELIGMFVNTLPLRSQVEGDDTFSALLSQVKATCLEAYEHQDAPFEKVVDALRPQRNLAISPIFQVMLLLQNGDMGLLDQTFQSRPLKTGISKFDLTFGFVETPEGLLGSIDYSTALYSPQTIARMADHFVSLCRAIVTTPTRRIRDLVFLGETERRQLLVDFNDTQADYPRETCIHELFNAQVLRDPGRTAVIDGDRALTYQELYDRSCDLALYLQSIGVEPDGLVGLCMERSLEMMVAIMGSEQADGAYVATDPSYPDDRLAYMLQDSAVTIVLTQERFRARVRSLLEQDATVIALDTQWPEIQRAADALKARGVALRREATSRNVSYVIYTSGSTGKPKGVQVEHQALVNRIHWMQKRYALTASDVVLQKTPYSFDVSVWEFFWPMITGASLVFAAPEGHKDPLYLESLIKSAKVTTLHFVPSMLHAFLDLGDGGCDTVRLLFCSGEALDRKSVDRYRSSFPRAELHNLYGPTEAAIDVTAYDCSELTFPFVPIGAPIDNTQIYILDAHNHPQPVGVPGELHIAGDNLARGYLNRDELTQEKFVANPFTPGTRMYKTGDLARWLDDGNIQYLGRIDNQVKIRGLRIELGEIEAALAEHEGIDECAVLALGEGGDKQLVAFYRAAESAADQVIHLSNDELRAHLSKTLPEYMIPAAFVSLAAIPVNSNGKVDGRALSRIDVRPMAAQEYVAPHNDAERTLVAIWAQVLGREPETIGVNDNFFELGGHSLLAVRLIERMRQQGLRVVLQALFAGPTVAKLAAAVTYDRGPELEAVDAAPDLEREATLDPTIVLRTEGVLGEVKNIFLTGATGFLGAFLLAELVADGDATIHCLVRAEDAGSGRRKLEAHLRSLGLWTPALGERIVAVPGDLASPRLGLQQSEFDALAAGIDAIYHSGANVNFYYPYSVLKAANVRGTEELLRMASFGRSKSFHFISTLGVVLSERRDVERAVISDDDPLPSPHWLLDGYTQSKWVAEKLVRIAASRGIPAITYRPGTIIGHSRTGATNLDDFTPSLIRGSMQLGVVPEVKAFEELHMMPVDLVSRGIVAISRRRELLGRVFNLTHSRGTTVGEMFECLLQFDPKLQRVSYETWRTAVAGDAGNALTRYIASFPDRIPLDDAPVVRPEFDTAETLRIMESAGIERPRMTQQTLRPYFTYLAGSTAASTPRKSV